MTFIEWIGFVVSLFGAIYLFTRDAWAKKDPVKTAEKERRLKDVLRQMGIEPEEDEEPIEEEEEEEEEYVIAKKEIVPPPPPPKIHISAPAAQIISRPSRVANRVKQLPDRRDLLISHILFGPPKCQQ